MTRLKREPVVTIFVRHYGDCKLEGKNFARGCNCPKWLRWSLDGKQHRLAAATRSWEKAEEIRKERQQRLRNGDEMPKPKGEEKDTLTRARALFLTEKRTARISDDVYKKYDREIGRFIDFCNDRSLFFPADINKALVLEFSMTWEEQYPSSQTRAMVQVRFKQFLSFLQELGWLTRVPKLTRIKVDEPPTLPLSKDDYARLLRKVGELFPAEKAQRVHALLQLMRHTGLAISDSVLLERGKLTQDGAKNLWRVSTARQKTGTHVSIPLREEIANELLAVPNTDPRYIFWSGRDKPKSAVIYWQYDLRYLFRTVFGKKTDFTPHSLRDTAAVEWLAAGIPIEEVSKLLGHTSVRTTEKSYSPWVRARQDRLDTLVVATW